MKMSVFGHEVCTSEHASDDGGDDESEDDNKQDNESGSGFFEGEAF